MNEDLIKGKKISRSGKQKEIEKLEGALVGVRKEMDKSLKELGLS